MQLDPDDEEWEIKPVKKSIKLKQVELISEESEDKSHYGIHLSKNIKERRSLVQSKSSSEDEEMPEEEKNPEPCEKTKEVGLDDLLADVQAEVVQAEVV